MVSVALFAADEDGVLVRVGLREAGTAASGAYVMEVQSGTVDLRDFLQRCQPDVVIYDVPPAASGNARGLGDLRQACESLGIPCVLTVADVRDVRLLSMNWAACILIRPYDADMARLAIREAMQTGADAEADVDDDDSEAAA